jgi:enoyl-CoA hydratase/carnithine racemase
MGLEKSGEVTLFSFAMETIPEDEGLNRETEMTNEMPIIREQHGPVTVLTMVYKPYNLIGPTLMNALLAELRGAHKAGSRAIVIRSGLRHFSAGADLALFSSRLEGGAAGSAPGGGWSGIEFLKEAELLPVPLIASVHGVCLGGGVELALACDYIIAASSAKIGSVESALGLHPLMGGIQRQVQRIGMARAKEMSMFGRRYDAATLERWGLINHVVPDEQLEKVTMMMAEELANGPTIAHAATKQVAYIAANQGVRDADEQMGKLQEPIWGSEDVRSGLASFRQNGPGLAKFAGR